VEETMSDCFVDVVKRRVINIINGKEARAAGQSFVGLGFLFGKNPNKLPF
jgi:hypothetical protein